MTPLIKKHIVIAIIVVFFSISLITVVSADYVFQNEWSVPASNIESKPAFWDLDGDGSKEIIVTSNDNTIYVLHPNNTIFWSQSVVGLTYTSSPDVGDIDGDTDVEIVTGGGYQNGRVHAWHYDGVSLLDMQIAGKHIQSSPILYDLDSDGKKEIIIGYTTGDSYDPSDPTTLAGQMHVLDENGADHVGWPQITDGAIYSKPAVGDIDSDSYPDVVVSSTDGKVYAWDRSGNSLAGWPVDIGGIYYSSPMIADINEDGINEVIIGSNAGGLYALKGDGSSLSADWPVSTDQIWHSSPVVADIDGDNDPEIVIASDFYKVYAFHHNGIPVTGWPVDLSSRGEGISTTPALADVDNDGNFEIIVNTKEDLLYLIDGDGEVLDSISTTAWKGSPNAADIDNDGNIEVVIGSDVIQLFTIINPPPTASVISPSNGSVVHKYGDISIAGSGTDDGSIVSYTWVSDVDGSIGSGASINASLSVGWHNITLTVEDNNGATTSDNVQIRVNSVPLMTVISPLNQVVIDHGDTILFNGTGIDVDGTLSGYNWTSDIDGELSNTTEFSTSGLSSGIHSITLNGIDNDGAVGSASVQVKIITSSPVSSGGGGASGGGEPFENIVLKEVQKEYIVSGESVNYEFDESAIKGIDFNAKTNAGYISVNIEVLKHTSSFVDDFVSGVVYKNINIWVGSSGYATEDNIDNAEISFTVDKSWISQYYIDKNTIKLNRYNNGNWNELPTTMTGEDKDYLFFKSKTPGFSPFAITGDVFEEQIETLIQPSGAVDVEVEDDGSKVDSEKLPGFLYQVSIFGLMLASLLLLRKQ